MVGRALKRSLSSASKSRGSSMAVDRRRRRRRLGPSRQAPPTKNWSVSKPWLEKWGEIALLGVSGAFIGLVMGRAFSFEWALRKRVMAHLDLLFLNFYFLFFNCTYFIKNNVILCDEVVQNLYTSDVDAYWHLSQSSSSSLHNHHLTSHANKLVTRYHYCHRRRRTPSLVIHK